MFCINIIQSIHPPTLMDMMQVPFPKIKFTFKGQIFGTIEDTKNNEMLPLKTIPREEFQECLEQW